MLYADDIGGAFTSADCSCLIVVALLLLPDCCCLMPLPLQHGLIATEAFAC